jgi:hypothetical protein
MAAHFYQEYGKTATKGCAERASFCQADLVAVDEDVTLGSLSHECRPGFVVHPGHSTIFRTE